MQFRNNILVRNRLFAKIITFYVLILLIISLSPTICLSDIPEITVSSPTDSNNVTSVNYSLISVSISSTEGKSSFINWNNSLVGYWNFEHMDYTGEPPNQISTVYDNSNYNNNAICENSSWENRTDGKYGYGFYFNGSDIRDVYLNCGDASSLDITNEITIELFIKENETTFNKTFGNVSGGSVYDRGYCVKQTNDGGYILVGDANTNSLNNPSAGSIVVIKTNSTGGEEWRKYYGGPSVYCGANYVNQTNDGGYIITGEKDIGTDIDMWLIKLQQDGTDEWNFNYGGTGDDAGHSVQQTSGEGYIVAGKKSVVGVDCAWLVKVDKNGMETWNYTYGGGISSSSKSVLETKDGYIVAGYIFNPGFLDNDLWIFKTDYSGTKIGTDVYNAEDGEDTCEEIQPTSDGGYIVAGTCTSHADDGGDAWLFELEEDYTTTDYTLYDVIGTDWGFSGQQTRDGGYILTGIFNTDGATAGGLFLIKTDSSRIQTWRRTISGMEGYFVRQTSDGGYVITGQINRDNNDRDILLMKTDSQGNITGNYNNQSRDKTLVGKGRGAYQLELRNGTIYGYINNNVVNTSDESLYNLSQYWHHVALTYDGALIKLYVNGTLKASTSCTGPITTNLNDLTIGNKFSGIIDEVRVWNRALNDNEIGASYNCNGTGIYSRNFTDLADLNYSYYVYAINESGGENQTTTRSVTVDNTTAPSVTSYSPGGTTTDTTPQIEAYIYDAGSGVNNNSVIIKLNTVDQTTSATKTFINTTTLKVVYEPSLSIGTYTVNITAEDNYSHVGYYEWSFNVTEGSSGGSPSLPNAAPTADAKGPYTGYTNTTITFTGSATDSDGAIVGYRWDFNNDGTYDTSWSTSATATHIYTSAGSYTVKLQVKDNADATATDTATVTITEAIPEDSKPIITNVQHTPKEITTNDTVTITATVTDDFGIKSVTLHWNDGTSRTKEMQETTTEVYTTTIGPLTAGIIQYWVEATNTKPQTTTSKHYTFTVITVAEIGNVSGGQTSNTTSEQLEGTGLNDISFTPTNDQQNVAIKTEVLLELPEEIPDPLSLYQGNGVVFQYYNITITANGTEISELDIENGKIKFEVNKNWFIENNVSNSSISLYRYYNNIWNNLTTTNLKIQNETHEFYEAETPGFSTFAVVGSKVLEKSQVENPEPSIPWILIIGFIIAAVVILIFVLFKAKLIYVEDVEIKVPEKKEEDKK